MLVAIILDAAQHLAHIVGAQMGIQSGLAGNALQQLLLVIFSTKTKTDKIRCWQRTGTFGREWALAIQSVVGINGTAFFVGCY